MYSHTFVPATNFDGAIGLPATNFDGAIGLPATNFDGAIGLPVTNFDGAIGLPATNFDGAICLPATNFDGAICLLASNFDGDMPSRYQLAHVSRLGQVVTALGWKAEARRFDYQLRLTFLFKKKSDLWTLSRDFALHS